MENVTDQAEGLLLSIKRLAQEFGLARETVAKRIAGIKAAGKRAGHPVYRIKDVAESIVNGGSSTNSSDPNDWGPRDRLDHYKAENEKLKMEKQQGELIPADEFHSVLSDFCKTVILTIETIPDVVERDAGLTGSQVEAVQRITDGLRDSLYKSIVGQQQTVNE